MSIISQILSFLNTSLNPILTKLVHSRWTGAAVVLYLGLKLFSQDPRTKAQEAEEKILKYSSVPVEGKFIDIGYPSPFQSSKRTSSCSTWQYVVNLTNLGSNISTEDSLPESSLKIWTLTFNKNAPASQTPLVLLHGLCAAVGLWTLNVDSISKHRAVYAIDLIGFGRSSRPEFDSNDPETVIEQHVEAIEAWRKVMGLEKFILLGHSMGGYLSAAYELKYPSRVSHLILLDPWGIPEKPSNLEQMTEKLSWFAKILIAIFQRINGLALMRSLGPLAPTFIGTFRGDLVRKFMDLNQNGNASVAEYMYYSNAQEPTGEAAFGVLMDLFAWAKIPIIQKWKENAKPSTSTTFIVGETSWVPQVDIKDLRTALSSQNPNVEFHVIRGAGHHVYVDRKHEFHSLVNKIAFSVDKLN